MTFCNCENRDFPDDEFSEDANGVVWHESPPRHTTLGDPEDPPEIPGVARPEIADELIYIAPDVSFDIAHDVSLDRSDKRDDAPGSEVRYDSP